MSCGRRTHALLSITASHAHKRLSRPRVMLLINVDASIVRRGDDELTIIDQGAQLVIIQEVMQQLSIRRWGSSSSPSASQLLQRIQKWKELGIRAMDLQLDAADVEGHAARAVYSEYQRRCASRSRFSTASSHPAEEPLSAECDHVPSACSKLFRRA